VQRAEFREQVEFSEQSHFTLYSALSTLISALCLLLVVTGITYSGWHRVRQRVLQSEEYHFSAASVHVTETPPWVPETIVNDVIADFNAVRVSQETLIDQELLRELAGAFRAYHWVESVDHVRVSFPATVTMDLTYRTPICMILRPNLQDAYAVDRHGVWLSSDYFTRNADEVNRYIKVLGVVSTPTGNIGDPWDDPAVELATVLVDHLSPDSGFLGIASIRVEKSGNNRYNTRYDFFLTTSRGTEIHWGEMPLKPDDTRKEQLLTLVRQYGSPDNAPRNANNRIELQ